MLSIILTSIFMYYRSAIGRCSECTSVDGCGFCLSSLQCLSGTQTGPSEGAICPSWTYLNTTCPGKSTPFLLDLSIYDLILTVPFCVILLLVVPNCGDYVDCSSCASQEQCAWCASENTCLTISDAFSSDCRGIVFETPCPTDYLSGTLSLCMYVCMYAWMSIF